jgi:methyltransferase (TIGR00027 family)
MVASGPGLRRARCTIVEQMGPERLGEFDAMRDAMNSTKHAVAATGLLVAAMRAEESARDDALFHDPFAERLAGDDGRRLLAESGAETGQSSAPVVVRTRLYDEALLLAHNDGISQVVILAAGMDARSYRLPWRDGATVYEVDQPQVIAIKGERLAGERSRCRRVALGVDLADDWSKALESQGFDSSARTVWLVEGLLQYIDAQEVDRLFARVDALSAPGSVLLYDVVGKTLLEAPFLQATLKFMQKLGAPWVFGNDTPTALVEGRGWDATVTDMAVPGNAWGRWEHPAIPADVPDAPRGYFVEAMKA